MLKGSRSHLVKKIRKPTFDPPDHGHGADPFLPARSRRLEGAPAGATVYLWCIVEPQAVAAARAAKASERRPARQSSPEQHQAARLSCSISGRVIMPLIPGTGMQPRLGKETPDRRTRALVQGEGARRRGTGRPASTRELVVDHEGGSFDQPSSRESCDLLVERV